MEATILGPNGLPIEADSDECPHETKQTFQAAGSPERTVCVDCGEDV